MIKINNLDFAYKNTQVFRRISLEFEKGNIYGLLGENGVGKTTLLKLICGLQKPQYGEITVDGFTPSMRQPQFLQNVFFLPEEVITEDTTPEKFIQKTGVFYPRYDFDLFNKLMKELEVDLSKKFNELSHGQKKKALLACAMSLQTDYLFLDEPTNGLDIPSKALFRKVISQYCSDETTVIISTHQVKDVENLIDPIVILDRDDVLLNASFSKITEKIFFEYGPERLDNAYYTEMLPGGYINVMRNVNNEESNVNIEALFNAVMKNKETIKNLMK
ncbi:MAG: ATP-binding cassette domain-containing protein [Bacteroidales bacterium]|jgi:ABC-2 type transport system ATP-binding protein|nr:ATP-binding cassette domain-containing protein [Bacteroidales bacterium]MBR6091813.1 ATP-binding cassette domain-containing protein [Bacteroidales bacterium]